MKSLHRSVLATVTLLFTLISFSGAGLADGQTACSERWITDALSKDATVELPLNELEKLDFSSIWMDDRTEYVGYIGEYYQRLRVQFQSMQKISPTKYSVTGYSEYSVHKEQKRRNFSGTIEIERLYTRVEPEIWRDENMTKRGYGYVVAKFSFTEYAEQRWSGELKGSLLTRWYTDSNDRLQYDNTQEWHGFANNQFSGTWTSSNTNESKRCVWAHYQILDYDDWCKEELKSLIKTQDQDSGNELSRNSFYDQDEMMGLYSLSVDYTPLGESSKKSIDYAVVINIDYECTFLGKGYNTYFIDSCDPITKDSNTLQLIYRDDLGFGYSELYADGTALPVPGSIIATLYKEGSEYFIKSPVIANTKLEYNTPLPIKKSHGRRR